MAIVGKIQVTGKEVDPSVITSRVIVSLPERFDMFKSNWMFNASNDATVSEFKQKLLQAELGLKENRPKNIMETASKPDSRRLKTQTVHRIWQWLPRTLKHWLPKTSAARTRIFKCPNCNSLCQVGIYSESKGQEDASRCYHCEKRGHRATECRSKTKALNKDLQSTLVYLQV